MKKFWFTPVLVALLVFVGIGSVLAWRIAAPTARFTSSEPITVELVEPPDQGAPGKTLVFKYAVKNSEDAVTYGLRYDVSTSFSFPNNDKGTLTFNLNEQEQADAEGTILLKTYTIIIVPIPIPPPLPLAKVWLYVDDGTGPQPYTPGTRVNITDQHLFEVHMRPGADSPPGNWDVAVSVDRGEPVVTPKQVKAKLVSTSITGLTAPSGSLTPQEAEAKIRFNLTADGGDAYVRLDGDVSPSTNGKLKAWTAISNGDPVGDNTVIIRSGETKWVEVQAVLTTQTEGLVRMWLRDVLWGPAPHPILGGGRILELDPPFQTAEIYLYPPGTPAP